MTETRTTCPYCGVGCGVVVTHDAAVITGVRGDPDHPANRGRLCTKGATLHLTAAPHRQAQVRALQPMRRAVRGGPLEPVAWDAALDEVAARFADTVERHGPDAVGFYVSGQLLTEDYHVFNKLAKGLVGTNNVDTNSRLCMSSAVAGYKASLGADAPPACYDDLALAGTLFVTGSNMAWTHPVLFRQVEDARRANPAQRMIVADPRRSETAEAADLHLQLLPGSDVILHHAMLHLMLWEGLVDTAYVAAHTTGFEALRDRVRAFTPTHAAKSCGLREADIVQAARWFAGLDGAAGGDGRPTRTPTLSLYCQGLNQSASGTDKNRTLINLHLATGQIGRPGAGPFSLTGQPNAMGGREAGGMATLLPGHREVADPAHRAEVAALWGVAALPARPGKSAVELFQAAADGELRALWIACTNPAQSMPDLKTVRRALERAEFVVVQEAYRTPATVDFADVLLPASTWGEKDGTVTNSERCISRVRAAVPPPGQARADWRIAADVAQRLERRLPSRRTAAFAGRSMFDFADAEAVWNEHREATRGRDLDITGLSYTRLDAGPQRWPCPEGQAEGTARLYTDGRFATPDGRAAFAAPAWQPPADVRDARHPVALTTGRLRDQWHGMSRTGTLGRLFAHAPEPSLDLHPQELARRRWVDGDLVRVRSRRGETVLPVRATDAVAPAQAFVAMHWGAEFVAGDGVNAVTSSATCPQSRQPELKHAAVRLEAAELPWAVVGAAWLPADRALALRERLRRLFPAFGYASCVPFGREADAAADTAPAPLGLLFRAARVAPADAAEVAPLLAELEAAFGIDDATALRYADPRQRRQRAVRVGADGTLQAFVLAGDARAAGWVLSLLQQRLPAAALGRALLAGTPTPPHALPARSPEVCACHGVERDRIVEVLRRCAGSDAARLQALKDRLRCGTACGSCGPALATLVRQHPATAVAAASPADHAGAAAGPAAGPAVGFPVGLSPGGAPDGVTDGVTNGVMTDVPDGVTDGVTNGVTA